MSSGKLNCSKPAFGSAALVAASSDVTALGLVDSGRGEADWFGGHDNRETHERETGAGGDSLTWEAICSCAVRARLRNAKQDAGAAADIIGGDRDLASAVYYAGKRLSFTTVRWTGRHGGDGSGDLAGLKIKEADSLASLVEALSARVGGRAIIHLGAEDGPLSDAISNRPTWKVVGRGSMLKELARCQFTVWTRHKAPETVMVGAI